MDLEQLLLKAEEHWNQGLPFVLYALPDTTTVRLLLQKDTILYKTTDFVTPSFVLAPFVYANSCVSIPEHAASVHEVDFVKEVFTEKEITSQPEVKAAKAHHIKLVSKILEAIENEDVVKVVASRKKEVSLNTFDFTILVKRLLSSDTSAFRYLWFHPETDIWCGVTPETLLESDGSCFSTMSLAGTQKVLNNEPPIWSPKDIYEQQLVTDSIIQKLENFTSILKTSKLETQRAGSLYHIKTRIQGVLRNSKTTLPKIANTLHPTPAVCGTPKSKASKIIEALEGYDREFYTGFLGPIQHRKNKIHLFVNLRCMKVTNPHATIYVGGGITKDSIPEDEWIETQNKSQTMLSVLAPML